MHIFELSFTLSLIYLAKIASYQQYQNVITSCFTTPTLHLYPARIVMACARQSPSHQCGPDARCLGEHPGGGHHQDAGVPLGPALEGGGACGVHQNRRSRRSRLLSRCLTSFSSC